MSYSHGMKQKPQWTPHIGIAACLIELDGKAPHEIKLIPSGTFKAKDGRPVGLTGWTLSDANAQKLVAATSNQTDQLLIDYEHQTLYTKQNGKPAPAAAWFKNLEWRTGLGLFATDVQWTESATAAIEAKEYRYISPVLTYNKKTGDVTGLLMAALVNVPAIDGLEDLAVAHFDFTTPEENQVDKDQLALLGLDENASADQITSAITALKADADKTETLTDEVAALKASSGNPDPAKFVPIETMTALKGQVDNLAKQVNDKESSELVTAALSDGRLLPAQKTWAESLDVAALKAFLKDAQPIAALSGLQTDTVTLDENGHAVLTADELAICKATGVDVEDYKKTKGEKKWPH